MVRDLPYQYDPRDNISVIRQRWLDDAEVQFERTVWNGQHVPWMQYGVKEGLDSLFKATKPLMNAKNHTAAMELMVRVFRCGFSSTLT